MANRSVQPGSNPYAGGAVVFDSSPYTNLYMQQVQKEAAKDEALDKYFQEWGKSINPAGMRQQDTSDLIKMNNENRNFYFQNKKAIKNPSLDNGRAYSEFMARQQDAMGLVNQSKDIAKKEELINKTILAAKQKGLPVTDRVIDDLEYFRLPVKNQMWRDYNPDNLDFKPKQFDFSRFTRDIYGDTELSEREKEVTRNPKTFEKKTVFETYLDDRELPKIESRAKGAYYSSPSVKEFVDNLSHNPQEVTRLNNIYRDKFKKDIQTPEDVSVAFALSLSPAGKTGEEVGLDRASYLNAQDAKIRGRQQGRQQSSVSSVGGNLLDNFGNINSIPSMKGTFQINNGIVTDKSGNAYSGEIFIPRDFIPSSIYSVLGAGGFDKKFLSLNDGFNAIVKDGRIQAIKDPNIGLIDRQAMQNYQLKFDTEPLKGSRMSFGGNVGNAPQKTETRFKNVPKGGF